MYFKWETVMSMFGNLLEENRNVQNTKWHDQGPRQG